MRRFHLRGAPLGQFGSDIAIQILPAQEGILVLRHAHATEPHQWIRVQSAVAGARRLDLASASADAVLLLGPLYHLDRRKDRLRALAEAARVVRPGAPVFVAAISRWATRIDGILRNRLYETLPGAEAELPALERTGRMPPLHPGAFCGYAHRPGQLRAEVTASGLRVTDLVNVEGPAFLLDDLGERLADDEAHRVVLETARALERVPELLGTGPHLIATAQRTKG